eukprot:jgi/Botrbrau1/13948/Bobra.250_1s0003.1
MGVEVWGVQCSLVDPGCAWPSADALRRCLLDGGNGYKLADAAAALLITLHRLDPVWFPEGRSAAGPVKTEFLWLGCCCGCFGWLAGLHNVGASGH